MAMDFFEHQALARKRTGLLLFHFFVAVFLTVLALNALAWLCTGAFASPPVTFGQWLHLPYWRWVTTIALLIMFTGSLVRYISLRAGGHVIAEMVHARRLRPDTADPQERMLLNVVEEMAIASGTPMPSVWVMDDEPGINAFVAGFEPTEAVLVITRGGLDAFSREELQGVVGHEFSHLLNGDMRLNLQLFAILSGVLLIGRIGEVILRNSVDTRDRNRTGGPMAFLLLAGIALYVVGYAGLFCGRLIKAAISRQREFLADASSVQFTRNAQGIGEALLTIRNAGHGSLLHSPQAEDMSHMCIAGAIGLGGLLATHPPLDERIRAIDPALLARDRARRRNGHIAATAAPQAAGFAGSDGSTGAAAAMSAATVAGSAAARITASVGRPQPTHMDYALRLYNSIPVTVRDLLHTPDGARQVIYGLIVAGTNPELEAAAIACIAQHEGADIALPLRGLLPELQRLGTRLRLPCHDLALPALQLLSVDRRHLFLATLERLVRLDGQISLREYLTLALMRKHLADNAASRRSVRFRSYTGVVEPLNVVFSLLCHAAGGSAEGRAGLHARVLRGFTATPPDLLPATALNAERLHAALQTLADLAPLLKKPLMDACIDCVRHDGIVQVAEIELVRAIGETLDCPVPPLVG